MVEAAELQAQSMARIADALEKIAERAPELFESPLIHESASFHERAPQYLNTENDIPVGFVRNA